MILNPSDFNFSALSFPFYREGQLDCAADIASAPERFIFLDAPTGCGKSLIYLTAAKLIGGRVLVVVGKKGQQDQLLRDFQAADVRGAANYRCVEYGSCEVPAERDLVCGRARSGECPRAMAIQEARASQVVITNYHCWLAFNRYGDRQALGEFDVLVLDEGHLAPEILSGFCSVRFDRAEVVELLREEGRAPEKGRTVGEWREWAERAVELARAEYKRLNGGGGGKTEEEKERKVKVGKLGKQIAYLCGQLDGGRREGREGREGKEGRGRAGKATEQEWVVTEDTEAVCGMTPCPWPTSFAEPLLFSGVKHVVVSSAFIPASLPGKLGLRAGEYRTVSLPSTFPARNRPLIYVPTVRVDRRIGESELRMLVERVDEVVGGRLDRKGIIHCVSYGWGREVLKRSRFRELMIGHWEEGARGLRDALRAFERKKAPAVFLSPSIEEGFDFKGELARYQIILRVPLLSAKVDALVASRAKADPWFLVDEAVQKILQMTGRSTRSESDWSETFIFDQHWGNWFYGKAAGRMRPWFRRAIRRSSRVPEALSPRLSQEERKEG